MLQPASPFSTVQKSNEVQDLALGKGVKYNMKSYSGKYTCWFTG